MEILSLSPSPSFSRTTTLLKIHFFFKRNWFPTISTSNIEVSIFFRNGFNFVSTNFFYHNDIVSVQHDISITFLYYFDFSTKKGYYCFLMSLLSLIFAFFIQYIICQYTWFKWFLIMYLENVIFLRENEFNSYERSNTFLKRRFLKICFNENMKKETGFTLLRAHVCERIGNNGQD